MYEEELTFFFFTKRQLIVLIIGLLIAFVTYRNMAEFAWVGGTIWLAITTGMVYRYKPKKITNPEEYLKTHPERREKVLKQFRNKVKEMEGLVELRKKQNQPEDEKLNLAIQNVRNVIQKFEEM